MPYKRGRIIGSFSHFTIRMTSLDGSAATASAPKLHTPPGHTIQWRHTQSWAVGNRRIVNLGTIPSFSHPHPTIELSAPQMPHRPCLDRSCAVSATCTHLPPVRGRWGHGGWERLHECRNRECLAMHRPYASPLFGQIVRRKRRMYAFTSCEG